ncbi:MAG: arsenate reductase ArsC, partial [Deinococcales bacterium]
MAEGWARHFAGSRAEIYSAGTEATFVKPDAIQVMQEVGIDLSTLSSKTLYDLP